MSVAILAEERVPDVGSDSPPEALHCNVDQPVDDLFVELKNGGRLFIQVKRRLVLSDSAASDLAKSLEQFVRQLLSARTPSGSRPWDKPLEVGKDALVLIVGPTSSRRGIAALRSVLDRVRGAGSTGSTADAATTTAECSALAQLVAHASRSWVADTGAAPSDAALRDFFRLIRIVPMYVEAGQAAETHAKLLLRTSVLRDQSQADDAWNALLALSAEFFSSRGGGNRATLGAHLSRFALRGAPSYLNDFDVLRNLSTTTTTLLSDFAHIRVGDRVVRLRRRSSEVLRVAAETASLVVVGDPGAGKSGALFDVVEGLRADGRDVVFIASDHVSAASLHSLRSELGLQHELHEVLVNWPGPDPGFLVIDALDAARAEPAARALRDLMNLVMKSESRWRVIVSIRKFDLRYSPELRRFFAGTPVQTEPDLCDPEFPGLRHFRVPGFTPDDLAQLRDQSPDLLSLIKSAPTPLRELLVVPFNLRLIADLLGSGVPTATLTLIQTQLELLDRYWDERVIRSDGHGDAREAALAHVCQQMIKERSLRILRKDLNAATATSSVLHDLLQTHVLVEWQDAPAAKPDRDRIAFSHHRLFDYAVSRLILRTQTEPLSTVLGRDRDLALLVRPSLLLHSQHLWSTDPTRARFWEQALSLIAHQTVPATAKIVGASIAFQLATSIADFQPLFDRLSLSATSQAAERAFGHLAGVLAAAAPSERRLGGDSPGPWPRVLLRLAESERPGLRYPIRVLLGTLTDGIADSSATARQVFGHAARRIFDFALDIQGDAFFAVLAIQAVSRSYDTDPPGSLERLRRCLAPERIAAHGDEDLPWLARELTPFLATEPGFVAEVYNAAFGNVVNSKDEKPMGGRIMTLVSNRGQDYQMALYQLTELFSAFLNAAPAHATRALVAAVEHYVRNERRHTEPTSEFTFDLDGRAARFVADYSSIWDAGSAVLHDARNLLFTFSAHVESLATNGQQSTVSEILDVAIRENRHAAIWRRLLQLGRRFPREIGLQLRAMCWTQPILITYDCSSAVGDLLTVMYEYLPESERLRIEEAILGLPEAFPDARREALLHVRNRLLGCLPPALFASTPARELAATLAAEGAIPKNQPPFRIGSVSTVPYSEEDYLADQGVPVEAPANARLRALAKPADHFAETHLNSEPTVQDAVAILQALRTLHTALTAQDDEPAHPLQTTYAWGALAGAVSRLAKSPAIEEDTQLREFTTVVLLEASKHPEPPARPEHDQRFDEFPSWGPPAPRVDAAGGLMRLAWARAGGTDDVFDALRRLAADPVPAVRFQIAREIHGLFRWCPTIMWELVAHFCTDEKSVAILSSLVTGPLSWLAPRAITRVRELTVTLTNRDVIGASPVRESIRDLWSGLLIPAKLRG